MAHGEIVANDMASNTNLELEGNGAAEDGTPVNFLPLCVLIIEPAALSMGGWCGTSYIMNGEMLGQIEDLVAKYDGYRQVRIVSLQGSDSDTDVGYGELRRAWEEVVAGGLGLWAVRDDHVYTANANKSVHYEYFNFKGWTLVIAHKLSNVNYAKEESK
jgi:hypothetical protein